MIMHQPRDMQAEKSSGEYTEEERFEKLFSACFGPRTDVTINDGRLPKCNNGDDWEDGDDL